MVGRRLLLVVGAAVLVAANAPDGYQPPQAPLGSGSSSSGGVDCSSFGCVDDSPTSTVTSGTTIIPQGVSGPSPWSPPPGFSEAQAGPVFIGPDGVSSVSWTVTNPTTLVISNTAPTAARLFHGNRKPVGSAGRVFGTRGTGF